MNDNKFEQTYTDDKIIKALELYKQGKFRMQICAAFDISEKTYYHWLKTYPEWQYMNELGEVYCFAWWLQKAIDNLKSDVKYPFNSTLWYMVMRNMFNWGDRPKDRRKKLNMCGTLKEKMIHLETHLSEGKLTVDEYQILMDSIYKEAQIAEIYEMQPRIEKLILDSQLKNGEITQEEHEIKVAELENRRRVLDSVKSKSYSPLAVANREKRVSKEKVNVGEEIKKAFKTKEEKEENDRKKKDITAKLLA